MYKGLNSNVWNAINWEKIENKIYFFENQEVFAFHDRNIN